MSDAPLVSIVIPTYERVGWVETAIHSVLSQDHPAVELIVVDDGSTDETPALLERIAAREDPARFRHVRHDNAGQSASINRGLELAGGELLGYLSSDDYLLPGALRRLVAEARAHPEADVLFPSYFLADAADHVFDTITPGPHTAAGALAWAACMPGAGVLVRRRLYERIGGWDPTYRYSPDYEWWLRAGDAVFHHVPEPLAVWRSHDGSISTGGLTVATIHERLRLLDELFARDDLPDAVRAIEHEAYASTLIQCAMFLSDNGIGEPAGRFAVEDALGAVISTRAREIVAGSRRHMELEATQVRRHLELLDAQERANSGAAEAARAANAILRTTLEAREAELMQVRRDLADARAERDALREQHVPPARRPRLAGLRPHGRGRA